MKRDFCLVAPMAGARFGRLLVESRAGSASNRSATWNVVCDCGARKIVVGHSMRSGATTSCGCLHSEMLSTQRRKHGATAGGDTPEYRTWQHINGRCHTISDGSYHNYGGRGITVCKRWRHDFAAFLADMGVRPSTRHSIDRQNNDRGYSCGKCEDCIARDEPANCRWATRAEQNRNRRANHTITHAGRTQCLQAWAEEVGLASATIRSRLKSGMPPGEALTKKPGPSRFSHGGK